MVRAASNPVSSTSDLARIIEKVLERPVDKLEWIDHDNRLYSAVHFVDAICDGRRLPLVVKTWSNDATYRLQIDAVRTARRAFDGEGTVNIPFLGSNAQSRVLVMERIPDPSIESLTHCGISLDSVNLFKWRRRLERACFRAGEWLGRWHALNVGEARLDELLGGYLEGRSEQLDLVPAEDRRAVMGLVAGLGRGPVCAVHGDFTPRNVLWSPGRFTVLDFGVGNWPHMTPAWDFHVMKTGIAGELWFATRSPARWINRLARAPLRAFEQGYGTVDCEPEVLDACAAVRHLNLYAADIRGGRALRKRAGWHLANFHGHLKPYRESSR